MTVQVKVNVMVRNIKEHPHGYYTGKFHYQQVEPLSPIYVKKNGDVKANLVPDGGDGAIEIEYNWMSTAVEINDDLYECHPVVPVEKSIWIVAGNGKPKWDDNPPLNGDEITASGSGDKIKLKDKNAPNKHYTYTLALRVGIDGGRWLIDDPKILNKGTTRFFSLTNDTPCAPVPWDEDPPASSSTG